MAKCLSSVTWTTAFRFCLLSEEETISFSTTKMNESLAKIKSYLNAVVSLRQKS